MNVEGGGPIIGPGKWVTIEGSMKDFTDPITTLTGQTIDLERQGAAAVKRHLKKLARERYALKNLRRGRPTL